MITDASLTTDLQAIFSGDSDISVRSLPGLRPAVLCDHRSTVAWDSQKTSSKATELRGPDGISIQDTFGPVAM